MTIFNLISPSFPMFNNRTYSWAILYNMNQDTNMMLFKLTSRYFIKGKEEMHNATRSHAHNSMSYEQ